MFIPFLSTRSSNFRIPFDQWIHFGCGRRRRIFSQSDHLILLHGRLHRICKIKFDKEFWIRPAIFHFFYNGKNKKTNEFYSNISNSKHRFATGDSVSEPRYFYRGNVGHLFFFYVVVVADSYDESIANTFFFYQNKHWIRNGCLLIKIQVLFYCSRHIPQSVIEHLSSEAIYFKLFAKKTAQRVSSSHVDTKNTTENLH